MISHVLSVILHDGSKKDTLESYIQISIFSTAHKIHSINSNTVFKKRITKISTASARFIHIGLVKHVTYFILLFIKKKILRFLKHLSVMTQTFAHIIRHLHLEKKHLRHERKSQLPKQLWYIPYGPILSNNTGDGKGPIYFKHTYFNLIYGDALPQCLIMRSGIK